MSRRREKPRSPEPGPTFADELDRLGLLATAAERTRVTIAHSNADAVAAARVRLRVIACFDCTATKSCCTMVTGAYLHEGAVLAARLVDEGRDTPALRDVLRSAADGMETSDRVAYARPCAFLGADDRCTVYEERPSICGVHLVTTPAVMCTEARDATVSAVAGTAHVELPRATDEAFRVALGLPALGVPYRGALPRMVLVCLEAWERSDFVAFLAAHVPPAVQRYRWATDAE